MKSYEIRVCGPQLAEPRFFLEWFEETLKLDLKLVGEEADTDCALQIIIPEYRGCRLIVSAMRVPYLQVRHSMETFMQNADGFIYMITVRRTDTNKQYSDAFKEIYYKYGNDVPVITLFNDMWCGRRASEQNAMISFDEAKAFALPKSVLLETRLGQMRFGDTRGEDAWTALDLLLDKMENRKTNERA